MRRLQRTPPYPHATRRWRPKTGFLLEERCKKPGITPHWQYLSRGGPDASCAAAKGLTARPVTLGLPVENPHRYEIMHKKAPEVLLTLLMDYLENVV